MSSASEIPEPAGAEIAERVGALRGAGVTDVDRRHLEIVLLSLLLVTVVVLAGILGVAGWRRNNEITSLKTQGIRVEFHADKCAQILGGSGSNNAGVTCAGTYMVAGHTHTRTLVLTSAAHGGAEVPIVTLVSDPGLVATAAALADEHPSDDVYLPTAILALVAIGVIFLILVVRRRPAGQSSDSAPSPTD